MDIGQWLNAIGLGQYEALFREHEIDGKVPLGKGRRNRAPWIANRIRRH
jgi:SAM (Sterile alpha motif) domain-containing protein